MPSELANTSLLTAFNIGNLSGNVTWNWNSAIDSIDPSQFYRFTLSNSSSFNLSMSGLQANANLDLLNGSGGVMATSANLGTLSESCSRQLTAGTYYIRVTSAGGANTRYSLGLQSTGVGIDPGSSTSSAFDLGSFTTNSSRIWNEFVSTSDSSDIYRVNLVQYSNLALSLKNLVANADLQLLDSTGTVLASSTNAGTATESIVQALNAGTYFVRVNAVNSNTSYTLSTATSFINAVPSALAFGLGKTAFNNTETLTLSSSQVWDNNGAADLSRVDFRLLRPDNTWLDVNDAYTFTPSSTDNRAASFYYSLNLGGFASGNYTLQAIAYDKAGTASNVFSKSFTVLVPNQAPNALQFGLNKTTFTNAETLNVNDGWVVDGNGAGDLARVDFRLINSSGTWLDLSDATTFTPQLTNPNRGGFSYSVNLTNYTAGNYTLWAIAYDKAGAASNTMSQSFTVLTPNQAPNALQFGLSKTTLTNTETLTVTNGSVVDGNGAGDLARVDFRLINPNGAWTDLTDVTSFTRPLATPNWGGFSYSLNLTNYIAGNYTLWAIAYDKAGAMSNSVTQSFTVQLPVSDWFSLNLKDKELTALSRTLASDGQFSRSDMMAIFRNAEDGSVVDANELTDLRTLVSNASRFYVEDAVRVLANKIVNGDVANQWYTGGSTRRALGNLYAGSNSSQMEDLISKWFLGLDRPTAQAPDNVTTYQYQLASGALFQNGISYQDIKQGAVGDCYFMAGLAEVALRSPSTIQNMFIDNGDNTFTVRFFRNGVADYVTVDRYLPSTAWGTFAYANLGERLTNAANELWVALAEKAYAQINESGWIGQENINAYQGINGGWDTYVFNQLTGITTKAPTVIDLTAMVTAVQSGKLLGLGSKQDGYVASNIVGNHNYVITGYNATTQKFTLFNPWGVAGGYGSDYSFKDGTLELSWSQITDNFFAWTSIA